MGGVLGTFGNYSGGSGGGSSIPSEDMSYGVASGTDTYTVTLSPAITEYTTGLLIQVKFTNANTSTTPTLNCNSLGAKTIVGRNGVALYAGQIIASGIYYFTYDGTNLVMATNPNISQSITNGVLDRSPSEDAVFDALALKKGTALFFSMASNTVGDLQTYYFGQMFGTLSTTTNQSGAAPIRAGVITGAIIATFNASTVGSNEACTLSLVHGTSFGTTDQITNALTVDANRQAVLVVTGLNITVTDCNALMKMDTPSIGTNPNGWQIRLILIYQ